MAQVIGIQHRMLAGFLEAFSAQGFDIGISLYNHPEIAVEILDLADRQRPLVIEAISIIPLYHHRNRQEWYQGFFTPTGQSPVRLAMLGC